MHDNMVNTVAILGKFCPKITNPIFSMKFLIWVRKCEFTVLFWIVKVSLFSSLLINQNKCSVTLDLEQNCIIWMGQKLKLCNFCTKNCQKWPEWGGRIPLCRRPAKHQLAQAFTLTFVCMSVCSSSLLLIWLDCPSLSKLSTMPFGNKGSKRIV